MSKSTILPLATSHLTVVHFNAQTREHIEAYVMLTQRGRQHPTLRFVLENPFIDVRSMMHDHIGRAYVALLDEATAVNTVARGKPTLSVVT